MRINLYFFLFVFLTFKVNGQTVKDSIFSLEEVIIESPVFSLPLSQLSHNIYIADSLVIQNYKTATTDELFQNINSIDVRRRGIGGSQSDLYIRGGGFEQVLLMVDGFKMDDLQTGHHMMNGFVPPNILERVEVVKGAGARLYGQNAMNGVVNLVTLKPQKIEHEISLDGGSFDTYGGTIFTTQKWNENALLLNVNYLQSDGYRYNTDFKNTNAFLKAYIGKYEILALLNDKNFGANGFYASPSFEDQYEETTTSLLGVKKKWNKENWAFDVRSSWRRNKDTYLLIKDNPEAYEGLHTNHKFTLGSNAQYSTSWGVTSLGTDIAYGFMNSNTLGDRERTEILLFAEQRFKFLNKKIDITTGLSMNYFTDFGAFLYPGIEAGYRFNNALKTYVNIGKTSRIPTYTNLYINTSAEVGNPDLKPEKAISYEWGWNYNNNKITANTSVFLRDAQNIIDWTKEDDDSKWQAVNHSQIITKGFEANLGYRGNWLNHPFSTSLGYTYMHEKTKEQPYRESRYQLNSYKHQLVNSWSFQLVGFLKNNINYRLAERTTGESYHVFDTSIALEYKNWSFYCGVKNLFDTDYFEQGVIPMPGIHYMTKLSYKF
jgi:iron complex outermembrane receptor protein